MTKNQDVATRRPGGALSLPSPPSLSAPLGRLAYWMSLDTPSWPPDVPKTPQMMSLVVKEAKQLRVASQPADRVLIADQIARLARHFAIQGMTPTEASTIVEDFIYDLRAYPGWAVVEACERWRNNPQNKYRPTPGQLKDAIHERVAEFRRLLTGLENIIASTETV